MEIKLANNLLNQLVHALRAKQKHPRKNEALARFIRTAKVGWFSIYDVEEIIILLEGRFPFDGHCLKEFTSSLGYDWQIVYDRPKAISVEVSGRDAIGTASFVALLIDLERIGLSIDPSEFVEAVLQEIKSPIKRLLTRHELDIFWFKKYRHKQYGMIFSKDGATKVDLKTETISTFTGYRLDITSDEDQDYVYMKVTEPKYRKRPAPIETYCQECGLLWHKGDPESSKAHRKSHKEIMSYLKPEPSVLLTTEETNIKEVHFIDYTSSKQLQREMYIRARAFKREMRYDFIQWPDPDHSPDRDAEGYLFVSKNYEIVGACSFYNRKETGTGQQWALQWIWICPSARRSGYLQRNWGMFKERYGKFYIEPPVSDAMVAFIAKNTK